jgi:hypothetical protein
MQYRHFIVIIPLTMIHKNFIFISTNLKKIQTIGCLCLGCNRPSFIVLCIAKMFYYTCIGSLEMNKFKFLS